MEPETHAVSHYAQQPGCVLLPECKVVGVVFPHDSTGLVYDRYFWQWLRNNLRILYVHHLKKSLSRKMISKRFLQKLGLGFT